jgi:hypothetical protein
VLESAIRAHRFGEAHNASKDSTAIAQLSIAREVEPLRPPTPTWEPPTYTAEVQEEIPSINLLRRTDSVPLSKSVETSSRELSPEAVVAPTLNEPLRDASETWLEIHHSSAMVDEPVQVKNMMQNIVISAHEETPSLAADSVHKEKNVIHPSTAPRVPLSNGPSRRGSVPAASQRSLGYLLVRIFLCVVMISSVVIAIVGTGRVDRLLNPGGMSGFLSGITIYLKAN